MSKEQSASLCMFGDQELGGVQRERSHGVVGKPRLKAVNRQQLMLRTVDVEKLVEEDHAVRAMWELVGRLDLGPYYEDIEAVEGGAGRAALDPRLLISLWIYAYSQAVGSAREVSRRCEYDPPYQWLTGMEVINHHTLSDFRVKHKEALDGLFVEVLGVLSAEGLVSLKRTTNDGTKVKANAGVDTFRREEKIRAHLELAREQVEAMGDPRSEETTARGSRAKERAVRERKEKLELAVVELEKLRETKTSKEEKRKARVSMTDPEARIMKQSDGGFAPSYNVQITTDESKGVIVAVGVSQSGSDYGELVEAEERVERNMGRASDQMLVDGGFVSRENILAMAAKGVDLIGPWSDGAEQSAGQMNRRGVDPTFYPEAFSYDEVNDTYRCPQGKVLKYEGKEERIGRTNYRYRAKSSDCVECPWKDKCCPQSAKRGRTIVRGQDAPEITAFIEKMQSEQAKEIYRKRGCVAEFPNAWIKSKLGLRQFRLRGLVKVQMEALWVCLTHNIQQWIRLCWRPKLVRCGG